ncbi:hypothetical protein ACJMK2_029878 [Sinanodonta woodiana]|uniref:VWFC domain-containing protein n=1 Tax=Sinanodonta woodiana TaxID=1069815 RepID=A0ABD3XDH7_SINWO
MVFYVTKSCLTLFLALLAVFCRGVSTSGCVGTDGKYYNPGDPMPSSNPCDVGCMCKDVDTVVCSVMDCAMPLCVNPIRIDGECCPVCSCEQDGVVYNPGQIVNQDRCNPCTCQKNGQITCESVECPNITCMYNVVPNDECCPVCQCKRGYKRFLPGEIVRNVTCKPLVCQSDGSIKAKPVNCPDLQIQCVDPVIPEGSCCPECQNGKTCTYRNNVILHGEDRVFGSQLCRCGGDPWFPNAFCTKMNVSAIFLRKFGQYMGAYKP